ncbi:MULTISPECIES: hypothetical protein [Roseiflexus]|jgi:anthranilate/para-aminobenzoate synthase component II|uniref:Uncharacterized protein n=1 Tax=Roseiflexus castenholzii (strain DSM 13941 / HLO8) TaxID=383372 RepID=A7NFH5_ROSCS|nr:MULTISPECIES: hypothetical protein [Roseiflexus]ABU56197.1 conserved hypothetical protein [Roseiflexus castenholzii DSM 13941]GIV98953.1 MAG: hypothetical protein KatS3mg058_0357 [Roseiflexus sp.]
MSQRRTEAFLLRLIVEDDQADPELWHGRVHHVGSGDEQVFRTLQEALTFIRYRCERSQKRQVPLDELPPPSSR